MSGVRLKRCVADEFGAQMTRIWIIHKEFSKGDKVKSKEMTIEGVLSNLEMILVAKFRNYPYLCQVKKLFVITQNKAGQNSRNATYSLPVF